MLLFITLLFALQPASSPAPVSTPAARDACNFPPEAVRVAPTYLSQSFATTFPGVRQAVVAVTIDNAGRVIAVKILNPVSEPFMNGAAVDAAKNSTYAPGAAHCKPVGGTVNVTIAFTTGSYDCDREADVTVQAPAPVPTAEFAGLPIGTERTATLQVRIAADGQLLSAQVVQSSGNAAMDAAALLSAQHSTYAPKMVRCHGVPADALFKVSFYRNQ